MHGHTTFSRKRHQTYLALLSSVSLEWDSSLVMLEGAEGAVGDALYQQAHCCCPLYPERDTLWLFVGDPLTSKLTSLAISSSIRLKSLPHAPRADRSVTASEAHGSQEWELIGHFMAMSLLQPPLS